MSSIFDRLFGGSQAAAVSPSVLTPAAPAIPSVLNTDAYRNQQTQDMLLGMSKALLAAGAPSPYPRSLADAFGAAGVGAAEGASSGEDKYLKRVMVDSQVQTAQDKMKQRQELRKLLTEPDPPPPTATASAPVTPSVGAPVPLGTIPADWEPHYDKASAATGLSKDILKAKDIVESGGNAGAVSPKGAAGPAQLMPGTAADLGVTNPKDPAQAIPAGAQYLKQMYTKYGNADDALAAYNWGPGNMDKWIAGGRDPNQMPAETKNYIAQIKARLPQTQMASAPPAAAPPAAPPPMPAAAGPFAGPGASPPPVVAEVPGGPVAQLPPPTPSPPGPQGGPIGDAVPRADASGTPLPPQGQPAVTPVQYQQPAAPSGPVAAPQVAQTVRGVINSLKPAERQLLATMEPEAITKFLLDRASPTQMTVLDSTNGAVVFVDKNEPGIGSRYQPVKAAELNIAMRNTAAQEAQAKERGRANDIRQANEPLQPPSTPGAPPTPTPGYAEQKGAVTGAEETARVAPKLLQYQGEEAIKDHQIAQQAAAKARSANTDLARMNTLLDGVDTGKMTATTTDIKAYAKALGIDLGALGIADNVGNVQAAKALISKMALDLRSTGDGNGMPGNMSDSDREHLKSMTPDIALTPEGRKMIIDYQKRINDRTIDIARIKNAYVRSGQFTSDPAGMWAKIDEKYSAYLPDGKPNPSYVPMFSDKDALPGASASGGAPAPAAAPTMSAIDAEIERRKKTK